MLGVYQGGYASLLLGLRNGVKRQSGLTGRLRTENLDYSSTGESTYSQGIVKSYGPCGNHLHILHGVVTQAHDGTLPEILLYVAHGGLNGIQLLGTLVDARTL